jgi:hypothetical protein
LRDDRVCPRTRFPNRSRSLLLFERELVDDDGLTVSEVPHHAAEIERRTRSLHCEECIMVERLDADDGELAQGETDIREVAKEA